MFAMTVAVIVSPGIAGAPKIFIASIERTGTFLVLLLHPAKMEIKLIHKTPNKKIIFFI